MDVYAHSQVFINGDYQITHNGTGPASTYPTHAGVRIDGNSEALVRGGLISQNGGPGILALVNSSIDLSGSTLTSNLGGPVMCDSSAWLVSDQPANPPFLGMMPCNVPHRFGPIRPLAFSAPAMRVPNISKMKADQAKYKKLLSSF